MEWLNYHHLLYFWTVAREGSIARASEELRLASPTISGQIKELERSLGVRLFRRQGRKLALTETGQIVFRYADEIFTLGRELQQTLRGHPDGAPRLMVGVSEMVPKPIVHRLLEPLLDGDSTVHVVCAEDKVEMLLHELTSYRLDLVITDAAVGPSAPVRSYRHLLGVSELAWFAAPALARRLRGGFPGSLDGAPTLLPTLGTQQRHLVEQWIDRAGIVPVVVGEFQDSGLMGTFASSGRGVFPGPAVIEDELCRLYRVQKVGVSEGVRERFYAITVERRIHHPVVARLADLARSDLFA